MSKQLEREMRQQLDRYVWLLSELHAGNAFSKETLWKWLQAGAEVQNKHNRVQ